MPLNATKKKYSTSYYYFLNFKKYVSVKATVGFATPIRLKWFQIILNIIYPSFILTSVGTLNNKTVPSPLRTLMTLNHLKNVYFSQMHLQERLWNVTIRILHSHSSFTFIQSNLEHDFLLVK
jgi:hypothetical protein